jgi:hypothetical protein
MAVNLSPVGGVAVQFFTNSGAVLTGGKIFTYAAGTTTPQTTFTNASGSVPHSNPIILDASGRVPGGEIWLTDGFVYKFLLKDANDVLIGTYDNIIGINSNFVNFTNDQEIQTATAGQTVFTLTTTNYQPGTNSLSVFVDGVNQYGSGAQYAYVETNSTTITFNSGLHVGAEVKFTTSQLNSTAGSDAFLVSYVPPFVGSVGTNVGDKLAQTVSVMDFGAVGDGVTDDTAAIQLALNSGASVINFPQGTYIIDGGLTLTAPDTTLICTGATIKLKNNASLKRMLNITGANCTVDGGTWDGNKANGNNTGSGFDSYNVFMFADRCTVKNINSINTFGIGIKGFGNYLSALNNRIRNTESYGIFFDGNTLVSHTGNRAIGNTIDMSEGFITTQNVGQGILFTAGSGQAQIDWELSNNNIIGPQTSVQDQAINLGVRGRNGIVSNNTTRYGAMGFSEGGANTIIDGNRFLELAGTVRYGIEPSGGAGVISNNVVTNALRGVIASGNLNFDGLTITGNHLEAGTAGLGVNLQIGATGSGKNIVISGNYLKASSGVYTGGDVKNLIISGNIVVGPSPTFASGRGVFIDTPSTDAYVFITGNTIIDVQRPYSIYSLGAATFNYLFATNNNLSRAGVNANSSVWTAEGLAVIGTTVISANNINPATIGLEFSVLDQGSNIKVQYGTGTPEGSVTANVGSLFINKSGGAGTTLYVKQTGTGNTGWQGLS